MAEYTAFINLKSEEVSALREVLHERGITASSYNSGDEVLHDVYLSLSDTHYRHRFPVRAEELMRLHERIESWFAVPAWRKKWARRIFGVPGELYPADVSLLYREIKRCRECEAGSIDDA